MLWNLLLVDPDNTPAGIGGLDYSPLTIFYMALIAIIAIITATITIIYLYNNCQNPKITDKKWIKPTVIISAVCISIILIILCIFSLTK